MSSFPSRKRIFFVGVIAGVLATLLFYVVTELTALPYPPEAIFQVLINPVPGSIQSVVVDNLRQYAKYSALTFASAVFAGLYGAVAAGLELLARRRISKWALIAAGTLAMTGVGLGLEAASASSVSVLSTLSGWGLAAVVAIVINLGYASYVVSNLKVSVPAIVPAAAKAERSRRTLLKSVGLGALGIVVVYLAARLGLSLFSGQPIIQSNTPIPVNTEQSTVAVTGAPDVFSDPRIADLVSSEVTDTRVFYRVDIDGIPPELDFDTWVLNVTGHVLKELTITKNDLLTMPSSSEYATLECVSNTINPPGALISNGKWTGVPLSTILKQAGLTSDAVYVIFRCAEGYTVGVPVQRALESGALLAYMMNDQPLRPEHGFPVRAIVPGLYGMMNAKWVTGIEASNNVYLGYWQERGWTNNARIKTTSIIYYPSADARVGGPIPIAGVAFAGDRGISKVEISTDGGKIWNTAHLKPPKSPYAWVLWAYMWTPTTSGFQTIVVRATDGTGQLQDSTATPTFPNGATGYNSIQVNVS
ncbi:MAG TPA: molybdopterin-dependent oxidoreductase [Candidatus Dormibacteraeota bacterium]|nr:molybdopterin-dependent oxidoreductase [Candidatus Dormibacteraeota bacterium]